MCRPDQRMGAFSSSVRLQIEQREGRFERQGNQHGKIELYAHATLGSMDVTMWQNNEHNERFITATLSGDRSIRRGGIKAGCIVQALARRLPRCPSPQASFSFAPVCPGPLRPS